jgi:hypothetical protein
MDKARRRPGFTIPGVASRAAAKNHELGSAHRFTSQQASEAGKRSAEARRTAKATLAR